MCDVFEGEGLKPVRETEGDSVIRVGDTMDIEGVDWTVENITTRPDGVKAVQVRRSGLKSGDAYSGSRQHR